MAPTVSGRQPGRVPLCGEIARAPRRAGQLRGLLPWDEAQSRRDGYLRVVGSERDMSHAPGDREPWAYPAYPGSAERASFSPAADEADAARPLDRDRLRGRRLPRDLRRGRVRARAFPAVRPVAARAAVHGGVFIPVALRRRAPNTAFGALLILGVLMARLSARGDRDGLPWRRVRAVHGDGRGQEADRGRRARPGARRHGVPRRRGHHQPAARRRRRGAVFVPVALASVIAWMTGYSVRQRRLYVVTLQQQAANSAVARGTAADRAGTARRGGAQHVGDRRPGRLRPVRHRREPGRRARTRSARSRRQAGTPSRRCAGCSACSASRT